jgi:hypothetical protein
LHANGPSEEMPSGRENENENASGNENESDPENAD